MGATHREGSSRVSTCFLMFTWIISMDFKGFQPIYGHFMPFQASVKLFLPAFCLSLDQLQAFFKHHTCLEMCIAGRPWEAMCPGRVWTWIATRSPLLLYPLKRYTFLGGVNGQYDVYGDTYRHPEKMFQIIEKAPGSLGASFSLSTLRPWRMARYWPPRTFVR